MKLNRFVLAAVASACVGVSPVWAQESSVYITQINQAAPLSNSRRPTSPDVYSRVVGNASSPASLSPTVAPPTFGTDLTTPNALANSVNAAGLSGSGAGSLTNNVAVINQFGGNNTGSILQNGSNNIGNIGQLGSGNRATSEVSGVGNITNQLQAGLGGNESEIKVSGAGNRINNGQLGVGNTSAINVNGDGYTINSQQVGIGLVYGFDTNKYDGSTKTISVNQIGVGPGTRSAIGTMTTGVPSITQTTR